MNQSASALAERLGLSRETVDTYRRRFLRLSGFSFAAAVAAP